METENKCNGERCKDCKYCRRGKLFEDIQTAKWRRGLSVAISIVFLASLCCDIFMIIRLL